MRKVIASAAGACCAATSLLAGITTSEPAYLNAPPSGNFTFSPLVTVGDYVPLTGGTPSDKFGFVGIPDAMGLYKDPVTSENILFVAHELPSGVQSEPFYGATKYKGAWVSRFVLEADGSVTSGGFAHKELYLGNVYSRAQPPLATDLDTNGFTRFCSGSFAGPAHGMDRPIFLTNEESSSGNFSAAGSQTVAIIDGKMHTLPDLARVARETTLVMPRRDALTAIVSTEDNGSPSFIYLYVGTKQRRSTNVLEKNGLSGGKTYVLAGRGADAGKNEASFTTGSLLARWVEIPNAATLTAAQLITAATNAGGFGLVRVEDAEFDPLAPTRTMFVASTGGSGANRLGRLYKVNFNPTAPAADCTVDVIYNADLIATPGGTYTVGANLGASSYSGYDINAGTDYPVSVDNIAVNANYIVICEDRNSPADAVWAKYGRNGGVWTLDRNNNYAAKYQGDFNFAYTNARDGVTRTAGLWEASGVIDASSIYGPDTFIINVQAHGGSTQQRSNILKPDGSGTFTKAEAQSRFVEDGQVLLMKPKVN